MNQAVQIQNSKEKITISHWGLRDKKYILFVGELIKKEGIHYLIEAFKQLEDTAKTPNNFKVVIVGNGNSKDDYVKYLNVISEGRDNIMFIGMQKGNALKQLMLHAYMFVKPSESKFAPDVLLKAMKCGLATLVSDINENVEIIGQGGFIFQSKSVRDLRDRLAYLLSRIEVVHEVGKLAKKQIETLKSELVEKNKFEDQCGLILNKNNKFLCIWKNLLK